MFAKPLFRVVNSTKSRIATLFLPLLKEFNWTKGLIHHAGFAQWPKWPNCPSTRNYSDRFADSATSPSFLSSEDEILA